MENKFTSFAYEEERSTYTEGESRSKRSSILKPPKARAPLQEVNLGGSADETGDFDTLRKRRVSFAGVNSVKEFCSNAESAQVCHIQSYEEMFSSSSDSSGAKSLFGTPKNVSSTEDKNFADDPMDLTDSIIDNNPIGPNNSAQLVRVEPVLTANALTEGAGFLRNPQGQTWNARKSALEHEEDQSWKARSNPGPIRATAGGKFCMNPGGENSGAQPRSAKPDELAVHWSCSMEMTEPLKKRTSTAQSSETLFHALNSSKPASDSGMEFTEAVVKMPNFLVDDNLGDASMEMTEAINRGRKSVGYTSSTNKSASMEFTEVIRKNHAPLNFAQSLFSGMGPTEPVMAPHHEPMARHSLFTFVEKGQPLPRVSYSTTPGKPTTHSPGNKSSSDMEMTGVLSLSKASRLVAQEAGDDMDITHLVMPSMPLTKKSRLSTEDDDDPFPIGRHLETDPADKENLKLPLVELSVSIPGPEAEQLPGTEAAPKSNSGKPVEEDEDTLALNFDNVKRGNSPVELSFLNEFEVSSPVSAPVKSQIDLFSSKKPLQYDVPEDHLLLFSLSTTEDVGSNAPPAELNPMGRELDSNFMASLESNKIPPVVSDKSAPSIENDERLSKPEPFTDNFLARPKGNRSDVETMRGVLKSSGVENDNLPPMLMSFKDFEIKSDLTTTVMMNTSLSTVGLDDSNILKAGFNDLTCPTEQVPACVSQLDITSRTPRPLAGGNTSLASSMMTPHAPELDSTAENSPICKENLGAGARKSEFARDPPREDDNTTHTSFSRPFYLPIPDKSEDTTKHGQSFPSLDLEPTDVGLNHVEVTDTTKRQSMGPGVPRQSLLPQNLAESCSMELTDVLNQQPVPARSSLNPVSVSKNECTDMELSASISTDETLLKKSLPSARADEPFQERPSSLDETNLAEPASVFKEISKNISQPPQDSPVSIASEETGCKSNVTNCAVERFGTDSRDTIDTEETFVKSELREMPYRFVESTKNIPRLSQSHPKSHFFPGMSAREETIPSELTDNHLINAGLNSTLSFHNFGSKGSTENVLDPLTKSGAAFANTASDFHDDAAQSGENFFAAHRASAPLGSDAQPEDPKIGINTAETLDFDQPKSRIRMSTKSNYFGNPEDSVNVEMPNVGPQHDGNSEVTIGKAGGHASTRKSAGVLVEEVVSQASRKSVRVIPVSNEEPSDSGNPNSRKSRGFPVRDAMQVQRKSGFPNLFGEVEASNGRPGRPAEECEFNRKSMGPFDGKVDSNVQSARKSMKINPSSSSEESSATLPSGQPSEESLEIAACEITETNRKSVGFLSQVHNQALRKSIEIAPNFSRQELSETLPSSQPSGDGFEITDHKNAEPNCKSVGFHFQEVDNQASRKSMKIAPDFSSEESSETLPVRQVAQSSLEHHQIPVPSRKSVEVVGSQAPKKSIRITRDFNTEKPTDTMNEPLDSSECNVDKITFNRKSIGVFGQGGQEPGKSVKINPDPMEESCNIPQFQSGAANVAVDNSHEDHSNDDESVESPVLPKRMPRKSCIGVKMDSSSEIEDDKHRKIDFGDVSEESEFAIKRNKRKSAVGVKSAPDADSDKESQNLDIDSGIKVSHDDVQPCWSTDEDHKMSPDDHLSQGVMNVSINDDDMNDFTDDERMHVSTPCKPRLSSRLRDDDGRKRSFKPNSASASDDAGVHDLSQDLMNVSLESDTRSPMLKKTCASSQVRLSFKPDSARKSLAPMSPLADKHSSARECSAPRPAAKLSSGRESLAPQKSLFGQLALGPSTSTASLSAPSSSTWTGESGMSKGYGSLWGLSHEVRVKNRDFMADNDFTHLNRQIYEVWLFGEVIGLKATFPNCELDEDTDVIGVTYTFKDWKLKSNNCTDKEVFEFYKNRLLEALPEQQLKRCCRRVSDLFRTAQSLKKLNADSRPLIERMNYLKSRYPCRIHKDCIEFLINDAQRMLKFAVKIDLRNDTLGEEDSISITNLRGEVKEDVIKLMFRVLPPQKDTFYTFIKELRNNTEKLLVAR